MKAYNLRDRPEPRFIFADQPPEMPKLRAAINADYLIDETACVNRLLPFAALDDAARARIQRRAHALVESVRGVSKTRYGVGIDAFLQHYDLSSQEGVVLMCLAEALIRIPDDTTADKLIRDKLTSGRWEEHLGASSSLLVNASTWGLMLTGRIIKVDPAALVNRSNFMERMIARLGEPVIRQAVRQAMRIMGHQFVMGRTIEEALRRAERKENRRYRYSFDMLGEAALTDADARAFFDAYAGAITAAGERVQADMDVFSAPGISVKLSALHPRYEFSQRARVLDELTPRLLALAKQAAQQGVALTVDAEESNRLDISLDIFEAVYRDPALAGWEGFGLAVQAYQKRAFKLIDWIAALAEDVGRRIPVRLVKGAYWDTEIKAAQVAGEKGYPVFTRKTNTDVSYLACAGKMFAKGAAIYPQLASHNAHTLASILELAGRRREFEFQRLHGMGEALYEEVFRANGADLHCRVYAPVGRHKELLPYLVRRLLENGANTSFVNRIIDKRVSVEDIVKDPVAAAEGNVEKSHPRIPLPANIYPDGRKNSAGVNVYDLTELAPLARAMEDAMRHEWRAAPVVSGKTLAGAERLQSDPSDHERVIGVAYDADADAVRRAVETAGEAQPDWDLKPAAERAALLEKAADLYEAHLAEFMALCVREAGKSIADSIAEVREAVDFLRYYATRCRRDFGAPLVLPGYTGERNELTLHGRGVFVCISPWNFPLAIFTGQIAGALAAGNTVLAKPAEQSALIAALALRLLHEAGVPGQVLHFIPGEGGVAGAEAVRHPAIAGVAFTGSTQTAKGIHRTLAEHEGAIPRLIAETGGQNAMLVDSSALPEQVVQDVIRSAFHSAGQRCSALRVLFLQEEIAPRVIGILQGYMQTLKLGDPGLLATDIGPIIDQEQLTMLEEHERRISTKGTVLAKVAVSEALANGAYFGPLAVEIESLDDLDQEIFGPILHIVRYKTRDLDRVIEAINNTGYGLTLGVHSRIGSQAEYIQRHVRVGNSYINRDIVGAVVGVQPFGGERLSGTGPKAGGPNYLLRFAQERTVTINTTAVGGNASLLALSDDKGDDSG